MAGRPPKTLIAHVRDATFRARRHWPLLDSPQLPWPAFALLQDRYRQATCDADRRQIATEFERAVKTVHQQAATDIPSERATLDDELRTLGKPHSLQQLFGFFPHYLRHTKGPLCGQPFALESWQQQFLREFFRRDRDGRRIYRRGLLGIPRGNGKTPLAAALGLYELITRSDAPEIYFAAGSKEQARIGLDFARSFVEQGELEEWVTVKSGLSCRQRRGTMQVISSEGALQHGRAPSAAIIDELWAFSTARHQETYKALTTALHKRDDSYLLSITTAGYDRHSLLGIIYHQALGWPDVERSEDQCLTVAKDAENGYLMWWYGAPADADPDDPAVIRAANPGSWVAVDDLHAHLHDPGVSEQDFRRLHLNQWTTTQRAWLPGNTWADLASDLEIPERAPIFVGVDVGIYHDSTAVCWAWVEPEGRIVLRSHVWSGNRSTHAHSYFDDGKIQLEHVEQFIFDLSRRYKVKAVAFDPRYFERSAQVLDRRGIRLVEYMPASAPMADAYQLFYQLAREGTLAHDGDPVLAAHVAATAADKTERGWKIRKLKSSERIDATVAAVLAVSRANHHRNRPIPQIRWMEM